MLIPILIFRLNKKKYTKSFAYSSRQPGLIEQIGCLIDTIITRLDYLPVVTTAIPSGEIESSLLQSEDQSSSVFARSKQRNKHLFQQMNAAQKHELLEKLKEDYRQILIIYFITDKTLKEKIDKFIEALFYANIPVPQIIEIHMELIDEFSTQLKLEGRSDETLLDYRLTLIDILAHLCEVYRCAIAKTN
ncbi:MAG TPA: KaiA family protein [Nostocaceae cyanobacterium]|nr:KaiA family protein [Nostocaceae cyanobacterium]